MKQPGHGCIRRYGVVLTILLAAALAGTGARQTQAQTDGCALFDWPVAIEREWFASPDLPSYVSGSSLPAFPQQGFTLALASAQEVTFPVAPEKPAESGWSGFVLLPQSGSPGMYQITLSDNGWIDVVQGGARLASRAHTGRKDCAALRKSVRFELASGPVTIQISGVPGKTLKIAVRKVAEQ